MLEFLNKKKDSLKTNRNWYEDKYQSVILQRNFLIVLILFSLAAIMTSTLSVINVTSSKKIDPFIIEVEDKTGITNVVKPLSSGAISHNNAMHEYFLIKYLRAREEYNKSNFRYNYYTLTRLLSTRSVYEKFVSDLKRSEESPLNRNVHSISLKVKSIAKSKTSQDSTITYQIRFQTTEKVGRKEQEKHYFLDVDFKFMDLTLTRSQREINPVGFKVTRYLKTKEVISK